MALISLNKFTQQVGSQEVSVIQVKGHLDGHTYPEFESELNDLIDSGKFNIIIDFAELNYISSAGLGVLLSAHTRVREHNGDLKIASLSQKTMRLFDLLGFSHVLNVYDSTEDAAQAFTAS